MCNQFVSVPYLTKYCQWVNISPDKMNEWPDCLFAYFFYIHICYGYSQEGPIFNEYSKESKRNRSTYSTVHHLIYGCEWTFLLALQTVWIDPDQDPHNFSLELDQNCLTLLYVFMIIIITIMTTTVDRRTDRQAENKRALSTIKP